MFEGGHRSVEVFEYNFNAEPPSSVTFTRTDGAIETVVITSDVWVTNENGYTIDKLKRK